VTTSADAGPDSLSTVLLDGMRLLDDELRHVGPDDWSRPTPCADWTVEDLVRHAADTADRAAAFLRGDTWEASTSEDAAGDRWRAASAHLTETLASHPADGRWPIPGDAPHAKLLFHGCDFTVHRWDLAVALGREGELPEPWVTFMDGFFRSLPPEVLRRPRAFHAPVEPARGDGPTRRLMAFLGRRPTV
jgi:uncharacterized protein (TIGR03086 family)